MKIYLELMAYIFIWQSKRSKILSKVKHNYRCLASCYLFNVHSVFLLRTTEYKMAKEM